MMMVVPARAGMSPAWFPALMFRTSGPRASGDEPIKGDCVAYVERWSPRERG